MSFVLDASLALSWFFEDEKSAYSEGVKNKLIEVRAVVPALWRVEVVNGLIVAERRKRVSAETVKRAPDIVARLPIDVDSHQPEMIQLVELCRKHAMSAYDAIYLSLALRTRLPIATIDQKLEVVCQAEGVAKFGA